MSIGHHIKDRGHVIERKQNKKTGEKELNQDFQNMDESECVLALLCLKMTKCLHLFQMNSSLLELDNMYHLLVQTVTLLFIFNIFDR